MNLRETLSKIQTELKAKKGQTNAFGKYSYRSAEDVLEALKPLNQYLCTNYRVINRRRHLTE